EFEGLARRVQAELGPGLPDNDRHRKVLDFFGNVFRVQPDVSALTGRLSDASARLSSGLATWVPRLEVPSGVVRVVGTAGSGKTQLALHMLRAADTAGQRGAYLCFNRALADHMARVLPVRTTAETFHQMADRLARGAGLVIDYAAPDAFDTLAAHAASRLGAAEPDLDLLVIDEMQDFKPEWVSALMQRLRPNGRAVLLEDPQQQLYADREGFAIEGEVTVRSPENYRSPRALVRLINGLRLADEPAEALGPYEGELPDPIVCAAAKTPRHWAAATQRAVRRCLDRGFALEDIAVVTLRGRASSVLLEQGSLGEWPLRRFTGTYDTAGDPVWTQGTLLIDTVYRFKGQAAHAVVLTECDFSDWSDRVRRALFVGITRARVHLEWVVSEGVGELVAQRLGASVAAR
ncbi:MAG: AAA family ATPase, partial [Rubrivivax sp.]